MHDERPSHNVEVARALSAGLTWALSTALFLYLGYLLDGWWDTKPVFTLIGAFVGAGAGFYYVYHQLMAGVERRKGKRQDGNPEP